VIFLQYRVRASQQEETLTMAVDLSGGSR